MKCTQSAISCLYLFVTETSKEVCLNEEFQGQCQYDEVIAVTSALYGHIKQGRCSPRDFGHFGCYNDVTDYFESKCSGLRSCRIPFTDTAAISEIPECAKGLATYVEASFICIKGTFPLNHLLTLVHLLYMLGPKKSYTLT